MAFLRTGLEHVFLNEYVDTLPFSRKLYPNLSHHRLKDMVEHLNLSNNEHRSISDCISTKELYDNIKNVMDSQGLKIEDLLQTPS